MKARAMGSKIPLSPSAEAECGSVSFANPKSSLWAVALCFPV
jgi:hypothetical protein